MHHIRKVNAKRREDGKRRALARWRQPYQGQSSADDLRKRALDDARGMIIREGVTYSGDGRVIQWHVRRSINGRTDQFDIVVDGCVWRMGGKRLVRRWVGIRLE